MDRSPPEPSVRGILQAWTLEWVARPFRRGSSRPRDYTLALLPGPSAEGLPAPGITPVALLPGPSPEGLPAPGITPVALLPGPSPEGLPAPGITPVALLPGPSPEGLPAPGIIPVALCLSCIGRRVLCHLCHLESPPFGLAYLKTSGGPVAKTPSSQCRGPGFDPRSGN